MDRISVKTGLLLPPLAADTSARYQLSVGQKVFFTLALIVFASGLLMGIAPLTYLVGFVVVTTLFYLSSILFSSFMAVSASSVLDENAACVDRASLDWEQLPGYSVLVPLYKETSVLKQLVQNLSELEYPHEKLSIFLLLEEDDRGMIEAVGQMSLPPYMQCLIVPPSQPRTKPKALNVGLRQIHSEFCVVYDAEDRPDPQQLLKAVIAFNKASPKVICLQAKLAYHNPHKNLLTRFFTTEYASWFNLYIPGLAKHGLLFLLGGTSNHFRTQPLREVGAWDPYNVTEDCDLGVRIARAGYRVEFLNSTTWEEANSHVISWIKQRSRWIKGYIMTYLAHMRNPLRLFQELGPAKFITFELMVGVSPLTQMMNPLFWLLTVLYLLTRWHFIELLYPGPIFYLGSASLLLGNFIALYINLNGCVLKEEFSLVKWVFLSPMYWVLMSIAAWRAFRQLIFNPHYWEKTQHGV